MFMFFKALPLAGKIGIVIGSLIALASIIGGIFYAGYSKGKAISAVEIAKYEGKINKLQANLNEANGKTTVKVVTEYKDRVAYLDRIVTKNKETIRTVVPEQYNLSIGWVEAYNASVQGLEFDLTKVANSRPSLTTDRMALDSANDNFKVCLANKNQLEKLIKWNKETYENGQKVNSK